MTQVRRSLTERLGSHNFSIEVKRQSRKTLAIHVLSKTDVEIRAPLKCPWAEIDRFLEERLPWIVKTQERLASQPVVPPPSYREGALHPYLGFQRPLNLIRGKPAFVAADDSGIVVRCMNPDNETLIRKHLEGWYRREAERYLPERIIQGNTLFDDEVPEPRLTVRKMRARWGSCDGTGEISINSLVMCKSWQAIDLVLVHELCHLRHFRHDGKFYGLLSKVMPDWREREKEFKAGHSD